MKCEESEGLEMRTCEPRMRERITKSASGTAVTDRIGKSERCENGNTVSKFFAIPPKSINEHK